MSRDQYPARSESRWERRLLGRAGTLRRKLSVLGILLAGAAIACFEVDRGMRPGRAGVSPPGANLADLLLPRPLLDEARATKDRGNSRVFEDFASFRRFLDQHALGDGVLVTRTRSESGRTLYVAFRTLDDPYLFDELIVRLPGWIERTDRRPGDRFLPRIRGLDADRLASRTAAEETVRSTDVLDGEAPAPWVEALRPNGP